MVIAKNYAKSLFQSVKKESANSSNFFFNFSQLIDESNSSNSLENYEVLQEELRLITSFLEFSPEILKLYANPLFSENEKVETILVLFPGLSNKMKSFLRILTERNSLFVIPEITKEYEKIVNSFQSRTKVNLILAGSLNANLGSKYLKIFQELTNSKNIYLTIVYNPKLLGGFILEYNSLAIDASIINELNSIIL